MIAWSGATFLRRAAPIVVAAVTAAWAGSARADLIACQTCSASNPLSLVAGSVYAIGTDGEALVSNGQSITWGAGLTNNILNGSLNASADFPAPGNQDVVTAHATATVNVSQPNTLPSITATASSVYDNAFPGITLGGSGAGGSLNYQVEVIRAGQAATYGLPAGSYSCGSNVVCGPASADPPDGTSVLIDVHGTINGSGLSGVTGPSGATNGSSGSGDIIITRDSDGNTLVRTQQQGVFGTVPLNVSFSMEVGTVYDVQLDASVGTTGTGSGSVFVDPSFTIDASDPNLGAVTLLFSNGIGSSANDVSGPLPSQVPEPSSLALALAGLLCLVAVRRQPSGGLLRWGGFQEGVEPA